jgi:hypothetical protein
VFRDYASCAAVGPLCRAGPQTGHPSGRLLLHDEVVAVLLDHAAELAGWLGRKVAGAGPWSPVIQNAATSSRCSRPLRIRDVVWQVAPGSVEPGHDREVIWPLIRSSPARNSGCLSDHSCATVSAWRTSR